MLMSATRPVENGSFTGPLGSVCDYSIKLIKKMQRDHIKSWVPKQDITDRFNEHAQEWYKHTVWKDSCRAWYKNNETGRVNGMFLYLIEILYLPFSSFLHLCISQMNSCANDST